MLERAFERGNSEGAVREASAAKRCGPPPSQNYFLVVLEELDVLELVSVPVEGAPGGVVVDVAEDSDELLGGGVVRVVDSLRVVESIRVFGVPGDADGATRSRSVTRSVLSVQPASTPAPSATTQNPVSNLLIVVPPREVERGQGLQWECRRRAACGTLAATPPMVKLSAQVTA